MATIIAEDREIRYPTLSLSTGLSSLLPEFKRETVSCWMLKHSDRIPVNVPILLEKRGTWLGTVSSLVTEKIPVNYHGQRAISISGEGLYKVVTDGANHEVVPVFEARGEIFCF